MSDFEEHVDQVMRKAQAQGVKFQNPQKVIEIMTRAVDPKTGKVYHGRNGLDLMVRKKEEEAYKVRNGLIKKI